MEQLSLTNLPPQTQEDPAVVTLPEANPNDAESSDSEIFLDDKNEANEEGSGVTKTIEKYKKKYSNISNDLRMKLLDAVDNKGDKIKHAAKKLGINYSSAKSIYQVFKREGRSNKKAFKRRGLREDSLFNEIKTLTAENSKDQQQQIHNLPTQSTNENHQPEPQDSLMALRDRLLNSRSGGGKDFGAETVNGGGETLAEQQNGFQQQETQKAVVQQENGKFPPQQQQQQQQQVYYLVQYPQAPMIFQQPMMQQGNFGINNGFPQFMHAPPPSSGPSQTININQPQAKNLSIQSITFPSSDNNSAQNMQGFPPQMQMQMQMQNQQQQQQQQFQYLQIQPQNQQQFPMMIQQPNNGYQYQFIQQQQHQPQMIYLMPQQVTNGNNTFGQQQMMPGNLQYNFNQQQQQQQGMMMKSPWASQVQTQGGLPTDIKQKMNTIINHNEVNVASSDKK